jgi:hypothetical protein
MFKDTPAESVSPDTLVIRIQPDAGIQLTAMASAPPPENVSRCRHNRFPHPGPLPEGEGDSERAARDFHGTLRRQDPGAEHAGRHRQHGLLLRRLLRQRAEHRLRDPDLGLHERGCHPLQARRHRGEGLISADRRLR